MKNYDIKFTGTLSEKKPRHELVGEAASETVATYASDNQLQFIPRLGNCQNYEPADRAAFILLQQVAQRLTRP